MTRFQTILARLCAASGETMLHVDSPLGKTLAITIGDEGIELLGAAIGAEGFATLALDHEVQVLMPGTPAEAEAAGHLRHMQAIKALLQIEGSSAMLITGSGKVTTWQQGEQPRHERLPDDLLEAAFARRVNNTKPAPTE